MVQTYPSNNDDLAITITTSSPKWGFSAGDTITGTVVRRSPIVAPESAVTVALAGRVRTKIIVPQENRNSVYRGRWQLLEPSSHCQVIYSGPLHLAAQDKGGEGLSWPFTISIPTVANATVLSGHFVEESFLPLEPLDVERRPLPGTFYVGDEHYDAYVEYYLQAELQYNRGNDKRKQQAILPFTLRHPRPSKPLENYWVRQYVTELKVVTQRLLPGMEHARLSFKQKSQKLFHTSKVPVFHFKVEIGSPSFLQLDNPWPVPLALRITPQSEQTSEAIRDQVQQIQVKSVKLMLESNDILCAPRNLLQVKHQILEKSRVNLGIEQCFQKHPAGVFVPCCDDGEKNQVNLGTVFQLVLRPGGLSVDKKSLTRGILIHPDFETYNIRHSNYGLTWEVVLVVAGETVKSQTTAGLRILPPS